MKRATAESSSAFGAPVIEDIESENVTENPTVSIKVIQPVGETLIHPYQDRLNSPPHTVPFEVQVQGLLAGLHSLRLSIEGAGERTLWYRVTANESAAVFREDIPLPPGPYRVTLSLPDATGIPPVTLEGKLPGYPYAPTKEDLDEWIAYVAGWQDRGKDVAVAWGLCNLGRDYYLLGMFNEAQESLDEAIVIYDRGVGDPERFRNACELLARIHLLRGDAGAMNAAYERWLQSEPAADEIAPFTFDWAQSRALLETDCSGARRLWEIAVQRATASGTEIPPAPPWAADAASAADEGDAEEARTTEADTPIQPARVDEEADKARHQDVTGHDAKPPDVPVAHEPIPVAASQVVLEDDFDSENSGRGSLRHRGFAKWLVPIGEVDLVGNGFHDACPGHGLYVDLGGTGAEEPARTVGMLQLRQTLKLAAGRYRVSFDMAGSRNTKVAVRVGRLGSVYKGSFVGGEETVFERKAAEFTVGEGGGHRLTFASEGPELSVLIDNIKLERLQTP